MGAILNGLALSKLRPYGSGFLIFSDYGRAPIRLSALMEIPVIYIFTHDSIGVGEDGPTHQPIEQLASLRAIPGLIMLRPGRRQRGRRGLAGDHAAAPRAGRADPDPAGAADARPHASTRRPTGVRAGRVRAGRRRRRQARGDPAGHRQRGRRCASTAYEQLKAEGIKARVVSMPSWELFEQHCREHPSIASRCCRRRSTARVSVEQASTFGWARYVGPTRPQHRHEDLRRVGAAQGAAEEVRLHAGARRRGGQGSRSRERGESCASPSPPITPASS